MTTPPSDPNQPSDSTSNEGWQPQDWQPQDWQPGGSSATGTPASAGSADVPGADLPDSASQSSASAPADDYSPYSSSGGYETPAGSAASASDPYAPSSVDPYAQPSATPYGQPSAADPYGQPTATPYGQPSAADPYGQPSAADPYGQPSTTPYGQPSAPPAQSFPSYQASAPAQPSPYGGQASYGSNPYAASTGGYGVSPYGQASMAINHPRAIPSMVLGIVGVVLCGCFPVSLIGLILGIGARKEITEHPDQYTGGGMALAGIILGGIGTALGALGWLINLVSYLSS